MRAPACAVIVHHSLRSARLRYSMVSMGGFSILTNRKARRRRAGPLRRFPVDRGAADGCGYSCRWGLASVHGATGHLGSVRNLFHRLRRSSVAADHSPRMDGEILSSDSALSARPQAFSRTAAGDQAFHSGLYIRVAMLVSAVVVGFLIVHRHSLEFGACRRKLKRRFEPARIRGTRRGRRLYGPRSDLWQSACL